MTAAKPITLDNITERIACRECKAPMFFARIGVKTIPVDAEPNRERGNLTAYRDGFDRLCVATVPAEARESKGIYYISHFATCTKPAKFRKGK